MGRGGGSKRRLYRGREGLHQVVEENERHRERPDRNRHHPRQDRPDVGEKLHGTIIGDGTDKFHRGLPPFAPRVVAIDDFGTVLECMDGRPQRKVADYLNTSFGVRNLDTITTAGLVKHLAENTVQTGAILDNLAISVERHGSRKIAVVAHHDCAGNPVSASTQKRQISTALSRLEGLYPDFDLAGLWINEHWIVERVRHR